MPIQALIIDDEVHLRTVLKTLLATCDIDVEIVGEAASAQEGLALLKELSVDLVFLDVKMPGMDGFALLRSLETIDFEIIFVTGFNQYAIDAIKFAALDYLLKPVVRAELEAALERCQQKIDQKRQLNGQEIYFLPQDFNELQHQHSKVALPTTKGFRITAISEILYVEAARNYSTFFLINSEEILVSRNLKFFETKLQSFGFFRLHGSYLVNLSKVIQYEKGQPSQVILENGQTLPIARGKKTLLLQLLTTSK